MVKFIFILIAVIFFLGIINSRGVSRLIWFFTGIIFLQDRIVLLESPTQINIHRLLIYTLLMCELLNPLRFKQHIIRFPLKGSMAIVLIGFLLLGAFDLHNNRLLNVYRLVDDFIQTFFLVFLFYVNLQKVEEWKKLLKFFLVASLIVSIYGIYNFITKSNPYDALISNNFSSESYFDAYALGDGRFRVNSFVSHPIYYGYLSGILFLLALYSYCFIKELKTISLVIMPLTFLNLILSNSRTPLLSTALGCLFFIIIALKKSQKFKVVIMSCLFCLFCYNIPIVKDKIDNALDIFITGGEKTTGSSVGLRVTQFKASYNEFLKNPLFGNGFKYITEELGATDSYKTNMSDEEFGGFESYVYHIIIEQGLVGIFINIIFFANLILFFLKQPAAGSELKGLGLAIAIMFLSYSIGTGVLGSWPISMGLIGVLMKLLKLKNTENFKKITEMDKAEVICTI